MKRINNSGKKIIISGYYGFDNFGDEAILEVLIRKLKSFGCDVRVISVTPVKTSESYNVRTTFFACPCVLTLRMFQSDILISGGGSLLQDVTSLRSLLYYLFVINAALFFRKKVIIFAQGLGPINNKFGAFLTKKALQKCTLVTVRDRKSRLILKKWGVNADLVCDPLFGLKLPEVKPLNKVGVQLRSFKTLKEELLEKLAQQVNKEFSDKEIEIYSFQDALDLDVCKKFEEILKGFNPDIKTSIIFDKTPKKMLEKISHLEYMIAMRFHANLIAVKYGIKTLAISYDIKVEKFAEEAQIPWVSMNANENYDKKFDKLKKLDSAQLVEYASSKHFDWDKIEELVR